MDLVPGIVDQINYWDKRNIHELKDLIDDLKASLDSSESLEDVLDIANLPTMPIPDDLTSYPIWAMDVHGDCLVGETLDDIEHIDSIRDAIASE